MFSEKQQENEVRALGEVRERLRAKYAERSPSEISQVVDRTTEKFRTARIRDYVPLLVEHLSRDELAQRSA